MSDTEKEVEQQEDTKTEEIEKKIIGKNGYFLHNSRFTHGHFLLCLW